MRVIETSLDEDLSLFSRYLWQRRVVHRIFEERGAQVLEIQNPAQVEEVRADYAAWRAGQLHIQPRSRGRSGGQAAPGRRRWPAALRRYPGLSILIVLALAAFPFSYLLSQGQLTTVANWLAIIDLRTPVDSVPSFVELLAQGQVWRWVTPVFLHFSVLHLGFNCAITIELGRRVEGALGAGGLWLLVLALAGVSNLLQYGFGGGPLFGGLSGVAYGLLGFLLVMSRLSADPRWQLPPGLSLGLLAFLVLFTTGVTEPFGLYVANAAHWGGLGAGALLAPVAAWRLSRRD